MTLIDSEPMINGSRSAGASVAIRDLTKTYGSSVAIRNICLDIDPGEIMVLLGPSGSGKTTTLNAISGFTDIDGGSITIDGADISNVAPRRRNIGMVFQNYALFPHMTVAQNILFPLEQRNFAKAERIARMKRAITTVRLDGYAQRKPSELSGGQQQRVALARSIVFQPRLLLMDEPLGALDRGLRESMQSEIRRIHREIGSTVVLVTHDQEEALGLADRIAIFDQGEIKQVGTGEDLYLRPTSLFVARFLGESTVFSGDLVAEKWLLTEGIGRVPLPRNNQIASHRAAVVVRPEIARITQNSVAPFDGWASLPGTLIEDVYLGASRRITAYLGDGTIAISRDPESSSPRLTPGAPVSFVWPRDASIVVPLEPSLDRATLPG